MYKKRIIEKNQIIANSIQSELKCVICTKEDIKKNLYLKQIIIKEYFFRPCNGSWFFFEYKRKISIQHGLYASKIGYICYKENKWCA